MEDGSVVTWGTGLELSVGRPSLALHLFLMTLWCSQGRRLRRHVGHWTRSS